MCNVSYTYYSNYLSYLHKTGGYSQSQVKSECGVDKPTMTIFRKTYKSTCLTQSDQMSNLDPAIRSLYYEQPENFLRLPHIHTIDSLRRARIDNKHTGGLSCTALANSLDE